MPAAGSDDAKEQIRARLSLVDVVQRHVPLRQRGREFWGLCPFHQEDTPSFKVNPQLQSWHCFGCNQGGDIFKFVELYEKVDFRRALEILADQAGVELTDRSPADRRAADQKRRILELNRLAVQYYAYVLQSTEAGASGRALLERRGVGDEVARRFELGYAPGGSNFAGFLLRRGRSLEDAEKAGLVSRGRDFFQQRLVVPIRDERGTPLAFTGRTVLDGEPRKYVNTRATDAYQKARVVFALDVARTAIDDRGHAVLMEGQFDVIVAHQHGVENAVASSGTALTEEQVRLLGRFSDELLLVFDNDRAGRLAVEKAIQLGDQQGLRTRVARIEGDAKDPDEFLRGGGDWDRLVAGAQPGWEFLIRDAIADLNPTRPSDREIGIRRINGILGRIKNEGDHDVFRREAGRLFEIDPTLLSGHRSGRAGKAPAVPASNGGLVAGSRGNNLSKPVAYLLQVLAVRPEALDGIASALDPELLSPEEGAAYFRMFEALRRGGRAALAEELEQFPEAERALVTEAWTSPPPGMDDEVIEDLMKQIRRSAGSRRRLAIIRDLTEAERRGDVDTVAALEAKLRNLGRS